MNPDATVRLAGLAPETVLTLLDRGKSTVAGRFVTKEDAEFVIRRSREFGLSYRSPHAPLYGLALEVLWATGCRLSEVCWRKGFTAFHHQRKYQYRVKDFPGIKYEDLLEPGLIRVFGKNSRGKGLKERVVFVPRELWDRLSAMGRGKPRNERIFPFAGCTLESFIERMKERTPWPERLATFMPHHMRHGHAVYLLRGGCDLTTVQRQLGHASIHQTAEYLRFAPPSREQFSKAFGEDTVHATTRQACPSCSFTWEQDDKGRMLLDGRMGVALRRR